MEEINENPEYIMKVEVKYIKLLNATLIVERFYDPNEEDERYQLEKERSIVTYAGKPNLEKTRDMYTTYKRAILGEDVDEKVEYVDWVPPEEHYLGENDDLFYIPFDEND